MSSFQVLMPPIHHKLVVRSNIVAIMYFVRVCEGDKEASNVSGIISTHLAASFRSTWSDVIENDK